VIASKAVVLSSISHPGTHLAPRVWPDVSGGWITLIAMENTVKVKLVICSVLYKLMLVN